MFESSGTSSLNNNSPAQTPGEGGTKFPGLFSVLENPTSSYLNTNTRVEPEGESLDVFRGETLNSSCAFN